MLDTAKAIKEIMITLKPIQQKIIQVKSENIASLISL